MTILNTSSDDSQNLLSDWVVSELCALVQIQLQKDRLWKFQNFENYGKKLKSKQFFFNKSKKEHNSSNTCIHVLESNLYSDKGRYISCLLLLSVTIQLKLC